MSGKVATRNIWTDEEYIWFWAWNCNGLFRLNKKDEELEWVTSFPLEPISKLRIFSHIIRVGDNIILLSSMGEAKVGIYNYTKDNWKVIKFPENIFDGRYKECKSCFNKCIVYEKKLYLIGLRIPLIVKIDMESFDVEYITDWQDLINIDINNISEDTIFFWDAIVVDNLAYIPLGFVNAILELDLKTDACNIVCIPTSMKAFSRGILIDGKLWFIGYYEPMVVLYDVRDKSVTEICLEHCDETINFFFHSLIDCGDKVLVFATRALHSYWIDKNTMQVSICKELDKIETEDIYAHAKTFLTKIDNEIHYWSLEEDAWYVFDTDTCEKSIVNTAYPESFVQEISKKKFNRAVVEKEDYKLANYICDCKSKWIGRDYYSNKPVEIILADDFMD